MALLSPGVEVLELDASLTVATTGSSFGCYTGVFQKGPASGAVLITSIQMLIDTFGGPNNTNYNDWFQCYNFLSYSGSLYVARLVDRNGQTNTTDTTFTTTVAASIGASLVTLSSTVGLYVNQMIAIGADNTVYQIQSISNSSVTLKTPLMAAVTIGEEVYICTPSYTAVAEAEKTGGTVITSNLLNKEVRVIANVNEYDILETSLAFNDNTNSKLKFTAKNPGLWGNEITIAIANPADFASGTSEAFPGIALNDLFAYFPTTNEVGVVIAYQDNIVETFVLSLDPTSKDFNLKSNYIEQLNVLSNYVFCKDNTAITMSTGVASKLNTNVITLALGTDGAPGKDEVVNAYTDHFGDKELIDIDVVIGNELANKECADFATTRGDCIAYIGATYSDVVGVTSTTAVSNLVKYCTTGDFNVSTSYAAFVGNYIQVYDKYNDKNRWVNVAGAIAGLRAQTNNNKDVWFSEAGLNNGQLKGVVKVAQNFNIGQRDLLYKNNINAVVTFPGLGVCLWGSRTTLKKPSVFSQVNVRMLFSYIERSISNSSKYVVFEQNDTTTRNLFISMAKPFLERIKAGRGIEDYVLVCDESNNTGLVRQNNQFVADFYIKPVNVINFITLRFTAVGSSVSFSEVVGKV
jgi:hypothetical protein